MATSFSKMKLAKKVAFCVKRVREKILNLLETGCFKWIILDGNLKMQIQISVQRALLNLDSLQNM
jgi:hypothetical protein